MIREIFLSLKLINPSRKRFTQRFIPQNFQTKISPADFGSFTLRNLGRNLFCGNVKTITCIVDEVLVEEVVQSVSAFDDFEDRDEEDLESDEDEDF